MSPEQAVGEREIDGRSDLYSLGVVGYQMLTGRVPFTAGNTMALMMKHMAERPRPIGELRPEAPPSLRNAIERALLKAPEDRWPTAAAFRDALASDDVPAPTWRADRREPVRYPTPAPPRSDGARRDRPGRDDVRADSRPDGRPDGRPDARPVSPRRGSPAAVVADAPPGSSSARVSIPVSVGLPQPQGALVMEPEHLAALTPEQRADLRLWHGRVNLLDRIKGMRRYAAATLGWVGLGIAGVAVGVGEGVPPLALTPIVPLYMMRKLWLRGRSLRAAGLKLRRVLLLPRAKWVIPPPPPSPDAKELEKLVPREVLDGPRGAAVRRAMDERTAIRDIVASLPKGDRALLPDVVPAVKALVERVAHLAQTLHRLDQDMVEPVVIQELDRRIAEAEGESASPEGERQLSLLRRQRGTLEDLAQRRVTLARQLDNAGLALGNLRLDLIKVRSSGLQAALTEVSMATQEARALSREIGVVLEAVEEVKGL
jgi:serine/threonine-protein kinase